MAGTGIVYPADKVTSGPVYASIQGRNSLAAAMGGASSSRPLGGITGVRPGTPSTTITATSTTWTMNPNGFGGYIDLEASATNSGYFFSFTGTITGTVTAAAGSARVDLIYVQVADFNTSDGSTGDPRAIIDYQAGVAGAGVPALTAPRAFVVAQINVPASGGGSPTVTWVAPSTAAAGGILPQPTLAILNTITGYLGQYAEVTSDGTVANNCFYRWNGTAWKPWSSDWISYTPTLAGLTLGNGTSTWAYKWVAGEVYVKGGIILGSTSSVSAAITISLPVNRYALVHPYESLVGAAALYHASAFTPYVAGIAADNTSVTAVRIYPVNSGVISASINSTNPFTWTTSDAVSAEFSYRAA